MLCSDDTFVALAYPHTHTHIYIYVVVGLCFMDNLTSDCTILVVYCCCISRSHYLNITFLIVGNCFTIAAIVALLGKYWNIRTISHFLL